MSTRTQYFFYLYEKIEPNFSIRAAIVNSLSVGLERSGSAVRLPNETPEKTPPVDKFTQMGSRDPLADHYEFWPTW